MRHMNILIFGGAHSGIIEDSSVLLCGTERLGVVRISKKPRENLTQRHLSKKKEPQVLGYYIL